ncbi:MAG: hypothetical protein JXR48_02575 [Candidatus Delongbacteria bacterium]|nr:hypothetical protein [Candidatus Delongbacteria bacterium]MBN2833832.1 hypothetical protein [Candidatus Delongbacteria bacterium]
MLRKLCFGSIFIVSMLFNGCGHSADTLQDSDIKINCSFTDQLNNGEEYTIEVEVPYYYKDGVEVSFYADDKVVAIDNEYPYFIKDKYFCTNGGVNISRVYVKKDGEIVKTADFEIRTEFAYDNNYKIIESLNSSNQPGSDRYVSKILQMDENYYFGIDFGNRVAKFDKELNLVWTKKLLEVDCFLLDLKVCDDGNLLITGEHLMESLSFVTKVSSEGEIIWLKNLPPNLYSPCISIESNDHFNFVYSFNRDNVVKIDQNGEILWSIVCETSTDLNINVSSVYPTSDGGFICSGQIYEEILEAGKGFITKYDTNGNYEWERSILYDKNITTQRISSIIQTQDQNYLGYYKTYCFSGVYIVKFNTYGDIVWGRFFSDFDTQSNFGSQIVETSNGEYLVLGADLNTESIHSHKNIILLNINSDGNFNWIKAYGDKSSYQSPLSIANFNNKFNIVATYESNKSEHHIIYKIDSNGVILE